MPNPSAVPVVLSEAEREQLEAWARRPSTAQALALRSRIVLACADVPQASNIELGQRLSVARGTVGKWRNRFVAERLDGLLDEPPASCRCPAIRPRRAPWSTS